MNVDPSAPAESVPQTAAGLVRLLDLEQIEENIFRGYSPKIAAQRVFGGQVAGQALVAAGRTVPAERMVHSLQCYFIRTGDPKAPIIFTVERLRDGRSFSVRRTTAIQHGEPIFVLSCSFQADQDGVDHMCEPPPVPAPESLPTLADRLADHQALAGGIRQMAHVFAFDIRYVDDPPWIQRDLGPRESVLHRRWVRLAQRLPDDPLLHICALTYVSDMSLLDSVLVRHGLSPILDPLQVASLDHAMWFHRRCRADEWLLYVSESPSAAGARGLALGRFFTQDGRHVASVAQEGLIRLR